MIGLFLLLNKFINMNEYIKIQNQSCPNQNCKFFGQTLQGNIKIHSYANKRLRCNNCKKTWVEHKSQEHYALKIAISRFQEAKRLASFKLSIRQIARRAKVSPSTVMRWKNKFTY